PSFGRRERATRGAGGGARALCRAAAHDPARRYTCRSNARSARRYRRQFGCRPASTFAGVTRRLFAAFVPARCLEQRSGPQEGRSSTRRGLDGRSRCPREGRDTAPVRADTTAVQRQLWPSELVWPHGAAVPYAPTARGLIPPAPEPQRVCGRGQLDARLSVLQPIPTL